MQLDLATAKRMQSVTFKQRNLINRIIEVILQTVGNNYTIKF